MDARIRGQPKPTHIEYNQMHLNETHRKISHNVNLPLVLAKWSTENVNENV
jgi:hypothetical protein